MSLFFRTRPEQRALSYQDVWGAGGSVNAIGGPGIVAGGLRLGAVFAATSLIADLVSTTPLRAYRLLPDDAIQLLSSQPQLVVNASPFTKGTRIDWLHQALASLLLRGNAYGYVTALDGGGRPAKIIWFNPDEVTVVEEQTDWFHRPTYFWRGRQLDDTLMVHIPGYTFPGSVVGYSPLALFKMQIETGLQAQQKGLDWYKNGAVPSAHLQNKQRRLNPEQAQSTKDKFKRAIATGDVFVTGADWDYNQLGVKADEAMFLDAIKATATQIAAIYRVSPEDIGGETSGTTLTYKTLEQDQTKLTVRTLGVWCSRIAFGLSELLPRPQYVWFDLNRLSQGDKTSRMLAHASALNAGIETLDEARAEEGKPPLTDDEITQWQDLYRKSAGSLATPQPSPGPSGGPNA